MESALARADREGLIPWSRINAFPIFMGAVIVLVLMSRA
jgi:hypothetical protein